MQEVQGVCATAQRPKFVWNTDTYRAQAKVRDEGSVALAAVVEKGEQPVPLAMPGSWPLKVTPTTALAFLGWVARACLTPDWRSGRWLFHTERERWVFGLRNRWAGLLACGTRTVSSMVTELEEHGLVERQRVYTHVGKRRCQERASAFRTTPLLRAWIRGEIPPLFRVAPKLLTPEQNLLSSEGLPENRKVLGSDVVSGSRATDGPEELAGRPADATSAIAKPTRERRVCGEVFAGHPARPICRRLAGHDGFHESRDGSAWESASQLADAKRRRNGPISAAQLVAELEPLDPPVDAQRARDGEGAPPARPDTRPGPRRLPSSGSERLAAAVAAEPPEGVLAGSWLSGWWERAHGSARPSVDRDQVEAELAERGREVDGRRSPPAELEAGGGA